MNAWALSDGALSTTECSGQRAAVDEISSPLSESRDECCETKAHSARFITLGLPTVKNHTPHIFSRVHHYCFHRLNTDEISSPLSESRDGCYGTRAHSARLITLGLPTVKNHTPRVFSRVHHYCFHLLNTDEISSPLSESRDECCETRAHSARLITLGLPTVKNHTPHIFSRVHHYCFHRLNTDEISLPLSESRDECCETRAHSARLVTLGLPTVKNHTPRVFSRVHHYCFHRLNTDEISSPLSESRDECCETRAHSARLITLGLPTVKNHTPRVFSRVHHYCFHRLNTDEISSPLSESRNECCETRAHSARLITLGLPTVKNHTPRVFSRVHHYCFHRLNTDEISSPLSESRNECCETRAHSARLITLGLPTVKNHTPHIFSRVHHYYFHQ
ncbi:hypothetical protein J6590_021559 [Homalodisca vitripennis]|nr:hypothetical protein J6590_095205 [Homalodisca vitripennis]KAG8263892.1 hypothetical protein J6590_021559 [Homalodisca vitripennis]